MYQGYKELAEVLLLDWLRKTALPPLNETWGEQWNTCLSHTM